MDQRVFIAPYLLVGGNGGNLQHESERISFGRTVLIGEADAIVHKTMGAILEWVGFRIFIAIDSDLAGNIFDRHGAELALMVIELALPCIGGRKFVEGLPTLSPRIPVLFTTVMGTEEVSDDIKRQYRVLHKPFTAESLVAHVNSLLCCQP